MRVPRPSEAALNLRREDETDVAVIVVEGEVDVATAPQLREALESLRGERKAVVDLCETAFMDSTGLHVLLTASRAARVHVACLPAGPVRRLFDLVVADELLKVHESRSAALAALQDPAF